MTQIIEEPLPQGHPPNLWEFFRMVSGLVSLIALAALVLSSSRLAENAPRTLADIRQDLPTQNAVGTQLDSSPSAYPGFISSTPKPQTVFYLVQTEEQAWIADWGENVSASPWRSYQIFYARDANEELLALQEVLARMLSEDATQEIQVIDLRSLARQP